MTNNKWHTSNETLQRTYDMPKMTFDRLWARDERKQTIESITQSMNHKGQTIDDRQHITDHI